MSEGNGVAEEIVNNNSLLAKAKEIIDTQDRKLTAFRQEINQCLRDFEMWKTAHGSDYPLRRMAEIRVRLEEIEKL